MKKIAPNISWILNYVPAQDRQVIEKIPVADLTEDSRSLNKKDLTIGQDIFVAVKGQHIHGREYIKTAINQGVAMVLVEAENVKTKSSTAHLEWMQSTPVIHIPQLRQQLGNFASQFYHYPSSRLKVIGVTGTNGKTSVSWLLAQLLSLMESSDVSDVNSVNNSWAVSGTLGWGSLDHLQPTANTTPGVIEFHRRLNELCEQGFKGVITEVSSHALSQGRVDGCDFKAAVMTQLGSDHLDYHHTIEQYAAAKSRLFMWQNLPIAVFNLMDDYGQNWLKISTAKNKWGYALDHHLPINAPPQVIQVTAKNAKSDTYGLRASICFQDKVIDLQAPYLFGVFQQENYLAAITTAIALGYSFEKLLSASKQLVAPPGRMQPVYTSDSKLTVLVDYAHTADALQRVLQSVKAWCVGKIWVVFGCGGERDRAKRPAMMQVAAELAHQVIITQDNPRFESPFQIVKDMLLGLPNSVEIQNAISMNFFPTEITKINHQLSITLDRAAAIDYAVQQAVNEDVVIIAGKGHEKFQEIAGKKIPFDDVAIAQKALFLKSQKTI